jgi:hypothetical protein
MAFPVGREDVGPLLDGAERSSCTVDGPGEGRHGQTTALSVIANPHLRERWGWDLNPRRA